MFNSRFGLKKSVDWFFGALPNTSFSQNVGLIALTGIISRVVVTLGAVFLIICGLVPKIWGIDFIHADCRPWRGRCGDVRYGCCSRYQHALRCGLDSPKYGDFGCRTVGWFGPAGGPEALQHLPSTLRVLLSSGLLPVSFVSIILNAVLPEVDDKTAL